MERHLRLGTLRDTTVTDAIERLQKDMELLHDYTEVFAKKIVPRFDKEFLIQAVIAELGSHIASYDAAIWRLVSGHRLTPPLLTAVGRHRIWQRWTQELPRALPFGEEVLSELPASYRLEGGTLFIHLHLPLLRQAFHLYHLQDFPVSGPLGKPVFLRSDDARTLAVSEDARTYALLDPEDLQGLPYRRACLPLYATVCQESLHHFVCCGPMDGFGARRGGEVYCCASD